MNLKQQMYIDYFKSKYLEAVKQKSTDLEYWKRHLEIEERRSYETINDCFTAHHSL